MPWIKKHNLFFIHIPKTAGSTILKMFDLDVSKDQEGKYKDIFIHHDDEHEYIHASAKMLKNLAPDVYHSCFKFAVVRNPYDRLISEYFWRIQYKKNHAFDSSNMSFEEFVHYLDQNLNDLIRLPHVEKTHLLTQKSFTDPNVSIFKYELLEECFEFLKTKYGVVRPANKINSSEHEHYESYYTPNLKKIVQKIYLADFHMFGYKK